MKLISIYIENFGCLHQYDLKFSDGLTVIREDNGFGKTTLAEFIRAMFYGFPRAAKTLDKNKRKKYLPWSGGKCGGHLTFELDGIAYRIERTFGTTPRGDTFQLIDLNTNQKSTRFTENIGVELFQLDGESFERSTYMPQLHEAGALTTDSIRAKLGDLVEDTNDINNFDKAVAALKNRRSAFVPYRGSGGSVAEARGQVSRLQEELDRAEAKRDSLSTLHGEKLTLEQQLEQDSRELTAVRDQITRASQAAAAAAVRQQYESLLAQRDRAAAAAAADGRFASGIPGAAEFEAARADCEQYLSVMAELRNNGLPPAERRQLEELTEFFGPGIPDEQMLEEWNRQHRQLLHLQTIADSQRLSAGEQAQLEELQRCFGTSVPNGKALEEARENLEQAVRLRQENHRLEQTLPDIPETKSSGRGIVPAMIAGLLMLAAGIGLMTARNFVVGGILLGIGILALIGAVYLNMKKLVSREVSGKTAEIREQIRLNEVKAEQLEWGVRDLVRRYSEKEAPAEALDEIRERRNAYVSLETRKTALADSREETCRQLDACRDTLRQALEPYYGEIRDWEQAILTLRMKRERFLDLRARQTAAEETGNTLRRRADVLREKLRAFLAPYYDEVAPERFHSLLTELRRECDESTQAGKRLIGLEEQLAAFRAEHGTVLTAPAEEIPEQEFLKQEERRISQQITECTRQRLECAQRERQLREELDRIPEIRDALERWQEKKDADQKNSDTLDRTLEFLQQAKDNLSGNYLGTIQHSFGAYLETMTGEDREKILVTGDLEVLLERQGQTRELGYFSAGQTDLVMLCMRLALVDALFTDVKPFVILDDPFVNLDDVRTEQALKLLKELAKDRQIIYLVCNSSRI